MKRVLVNGLKSRTGGGRSILHNYLTLLKESDLREEYYVLTPDAEAFQEYATSGIHLVELGGFYDRNVFFPALYGIAFPRLLRRLGIDLVFNFGDIPLATRVPQIVLFDWPYALYPESLAWSRMGLRARGVRVTKRMVFRIFLRYVDVMIAQTETARIRLERLYGLDNVVVVPNAVSLDNLDGTDEHPLHLPEGRTRLLYLSRWYPHKNIDVLLPLARRIRARGLPRVIVTTLDPLEHRGAARFLDEVAREGLDDVIVNIGSVPRELVPSVYQSCDALLMPTLLESFSGCYVEAMYHGLPILTSDRDFARDLCGGAARYFDPVSADAILDAIEQTFSDDRERARIITSGRERVAAMPGWPQVFSTYQRLIADQLFRGETRQRDRTS